MDDRPDELLEQCGRIASQLGLALAWTDAVAGDGAKACTRAGSANWKRAAVISTNEETAAAYSKTRARRRNPAVVASASNLVLVESDDGEFDELCARHGLPLLPPSVRVRSGRGEHVYGRPPAGWAGPLKIQLSPQGVTCSTDGYLVGAGALHPSGHVYAYLNGVTEIAVVPLGFLETAAELGHEARAWANHAIETGEPIPEDHRRDTIFHLALTLARQGVAHAEILQRALLLNREQCRPVLDERLVREQVKGALTYARRNPGEAESARAKARRVLDDRRAGKSDPPPRQTESKTKRRTVSRRPLCEIAAERVELLADTPIPVGTLSLYPGVGGLGKSALSLAYAKRVTDKSDAVLVISYEDAAGAVIRPRFEALGGDLDGLFVLQIDSLEGEVSFPADLPELDRHVRETRARLVIIDPVSASIDLKLDAHRDQDVRVVLGQLARLAERERFAALQIAHLNKAPGNDPYFRINGSTAFYNAARLVVTVTPDTTDPDWQRLVVAHKFNYGAVPALERWRIEPVTIDTPAGPIEVMTLQFVEIADDVAREDVLAPATLDKTDAALVFLRSALVDGDWHDSLGLKALAGAQRIAERTLKRAAAELEVDVERRGFPSSTWWRLPQSGQTPAPEAGPTVEPA